LEKSLWGQGSCFFQNLSNLPNNKERNIERLASEKELKETVKNLYLKRGCVLCKGKKLKNESGGLCARGAKAEGDARRVRKRSNKKAKSSGHLTSQRGGSREKGGKERSIPFSSIKSN